MIPTAAPSGSGVARRRQTNASRTPAGLDPRPGLGTVCVVVAGYLLFALFLYQGLWADLDRRYLADSGPDQTAFEWLFAVVAHNVLELRSPLFTTLQNAPLGVNLMANASMLGLSIPLAPVTWLAGPSTTWALVLTGGLAATAAAWWWLLVRWVVRSPWAAAVGGAVCAFAPPMVSHGTAHPNLAVLFLIPLIIDRLLRLCEGGRIVRNGLILGLLLTYQIFLGEEALLIAALGMVIFAIAYAGMAWPRARAALLPMVKGLGIAAAVCLPLVAYPLAWQFFGEQSYSGIMHHPKTANSPLALVEFAGRSLAGDELTADGLSMNRTEQNAFFGWPLLVLVAALVIGMWRQAYVRALAVTAVVAAWLSLGTRIPIPTTDFAVPGPWRLLDGLPVLEAIIESRLAMICVPVFGILIALAWDRLTGIGDRVARWIGWGAIAAALVPIVPTPYPTIERPQVPPFITAGTWRSYVPEGRSLVVAPLPSAADVTGLDWQITADLGFPIAGGYFVGPYTPENRIGVYGAVPRATTQLLGRVARTGRLPQIGSRERRSLQEDLAFWRAGAVVTGPTPHEEPLRLALEQLFGRPGEHVGGVWVWRVDRPL